MKNMRPSNLDHESPRNRRENAKNMNKTTTRDKSSRDLSVFPHRFFRNQKNRRDWTDPAPVVSGLVHGKKHGRTLTKTNMAPENDGLSNRNLLFQVSIFMGYVSFREGTFQ